MERAAFYDEREIRSADEREATLMQALPLTMVRALGAPGWAARFPGVAGTDIRSRAALAHLPVTRKSDLKALQDALPPFGGFNATGMSELGRIYMSPGPIFDPEGRGEDWWRFARAMHAAGFRRGEIIQNCFSYHFTPAAFMADHGARKLGCPVIPAGTGNTEMQVEAMATLRPANYIGTPSFLKIILHKAAEMHVDVGGLAHALVGGEALPPSLRAELVALGPSVLQLYATADLGLIAYETLSDGAVNPGMVLDEDVIVEIVRPGTGEVLADGEIGEVVVTSLNPDYPLIRFGTGDLSAVLAGKSPCGRTNTRIRGWLGRADQTTKVRAMFVHPGQVAEIVRRHPGIARARLVVSGRVGADVMTLHCEAESGAPDLAASIDAIIETAREVTKLRAEVVVVPVGSLPRDGKIIADDRSYD